MGSVPFLLSYFLPSDLVLASCHPFNFPLNIPPFSALFLSLNSSLLAFYLYHVTHHNPFTLISPFPLRSIPQSGTADAEIKNPHGGSPGLLVLLLLLLI